MQDPHTSYDSNHSVLDDLEFPDTPEEASKGLRFVNMILDLVFMIAFFFVVCAIAGVVIGLTGNRDLLTFVLPPENYFGQLLWGAVLTAIYYTATEGMMKGRSLAKLITGTRAVDRLTYEPVSVLQAFLRSLCRSIPFAPLAALFGTPLHDAFTRTFVVKKRK